MTVHRYFYPLVKKPRDGAIPTSNPTVFASPLVTPDGVKLKFLKPEQTLVPEELQMLARWLYSISKEAQELAVAGLITPETAYDVGEGKLVPLKSDLRTK